jgi:hypothetical protein
MQRQQMIGLLLVWVAALGLTSCAQDVGDIDRTQPNKLKKSALEGEWYMRQTVVGVPGTAMSSFVGLEGDANRIRFVAQESTLVAHRVHEDVLGIDTAKPPVIGEDVVISDTTPEGWTGAPVAAFRVLGHFDVQREYNPSTGEQSNVISENASDRHWSDRDFIRVDWTQNLIATSVNPMVDIEHQSTTQWWQPGNDEASPLYVECRDAAGQWIDCDPEDLSSQDQLAYLDVTTSYVIEPNWIACVLTFGFPNYGGDCGPETIQIRTSFMKIPEGDPERYEPRVYTDKEMSWFGFFRTERCRYDRLYGCVDQGRVFMASRRRIWEDWKDASGQRLPYNERTPKPIIYYINEDFPLDLLDEAATVGAEYDDIFTGIVQATGNLQRSQSMYYVCANNQDQVNLWRVALLKGDGQGAEQVAQSLPDIPNAADLWAQTSGWDPTWVADGRSREAVVAELVKGYNDGACDRLSKHKRIGDLRYSYLAWIDNPQQEGPLGYGPSANDPVTGEAFTVDAFLYGASLDTYVQYTVDIIDLINGDLDPVAFGHGEHIDGYLRDIDARFGYRSSPAKLEAAEQKRVADFQAKLEQAKARRSTPDFQSRLSIDPSLLIKETDNAQTIWQQLRGTPLESMLLTPEVKVGLGAGLFGPDDPVSQDMIDAIDPAALLMPPSSSRTSQTHSDSAYSHWKQFERLSNPKGDGNGCMYMASFLDNQLLGLAMDFKDKYGHITDPTERRLRIFYDLRGSIFLHVAEHEIGHTVGLRHNFESSFDAMNYHPEYWRIRFQTDKQLGYSHVKPDRGITLYDHQKNIREYQFSSTMDYGARPNSQFHGLGLYDRAALSYAYADLVHVFKPDAVPHKLTATFERVTNYDPETKSGSNYNLIREEVPLGRSSQQITDWKDIEDARIVERGTDNVISTDGFDHDLNFWHYSVIPALFLANFDDPNGGNMEVMYNREFIPLADYQQGGRLRVPYRFCGDEYRGALPGCNVFDEGADYNELVQTAIEGYDAYYFINSYRRGRAGWGLYLWPYIMRLYNRYFLPVSNIYQQWYIRSIEWGVEFSSNPYAGGIQQVGVEDGLRALLGVLSQPHPGTYRFNADRNQFIHITNDLGYRCSAFDKACEDFPDPRDTGDAADYLDLEPGLMVKWRYSRFQYDSGYYYYLHYEILSSFWDRLAALWALTNPETNFKGVDSSSDIVGFQIPYYALYDYELSRFFGGIIAEDFGNFAPVIPTLGAPGGNTAGSVLTQFALQDPLGTWKQLNDYRDANQYRLINPYPESYNHSSFTDRLFTGAYALSFFQVLYDQSFNHACHIFVSGQGDGFTLADSDSDGVLDIQEGSVDRNDNNIPAYLDPAETPSEADWFPMPDIEAYTDPFNNKTYVAVDYRDYDLAGRRHYVPAIEMLRQANAWKALYERDPANFSIKREVQSARQSIELLIMTNQVFMLINSPWWIPDLTP